MTQHNPRDPNQIEYVLRLADNALILGQRLGEWCGHAPVLEEDLALSNIALDLIGQARLLLSHAGRIDGSGRDEDQLAFLRTENQFRNLTLCELPNGDFARTMLRIFLFASLHCLLWEKLGQSADAELAAIAAKSLKESRYHQHHAAEWVIRLGDGSVESHRRSQQALDYLWPYTAEFFSPSPADQAAATNGLGPAWATLEQDWLGVVHPVLGEATLALPATTSFRSTGKFGRHSEHMGHLLAPMQYLQRSYPGGQW